MSPVNDSGGGEARQRDHQHRDPRRHQADDRPGPEHPGRRRAEDRALLKKLDEVVIRLQHRRPDPAGEQGLGLGDHPQEQRRQRRVPREYGPCGERSSPPLLS